MIVGSLIFFIFPEISVFGGVYESHKENMEKINPQSQLPSNQTQNTKITIEISEAQAIMQMFEATLESMPQVW